MHRNIVDELLGSLNVSIFKTRLDKNLSERKLEIINNKLLLDKKEIKQNDIKRLINLCMTEGDLKKMQTIGVYLIKNKEIIKTLNIYEVVSTNNIECICTYVKTNPFRDEFFIKVLIEAIVETQSLENVLVILEAGRLVNKETEKQVLDTTNENLILTYAIKYDVNQLAFQNKLIELSKTKNNIKYIINYYLSKKPIFFTNIEDTILNHQFDRTNMEIIIEYLNSNKSARKNLFDEKVKNLKDEDLKKYYFMIIHDEEIETPKIKALKL